MRSVEDPRSIARVVRRVALRYAGGADAALDRPAHVRAASGLCWWRDRLAVISDDASFLGLVDPATGLTDPITLPHAPGGNRQFDTGRGNKADKLDLECMLAITQRLYAFGSDSGLEVRRQVLSITGSIAGDEVRLDARPRLYDALRVPELGGGVLNIEGALAAGPTVMFANRGGDVGPDGRATPDALLALSVGDFMNLIDDPAYPPNRPTRCRIVELGDLDGAALHLTKLALLRDRTIAFAATAEATTSAYDDGAVAGSVIGRLTADGARWMRVLDERGDLLVAKIEGIAAGPAPDRIFAAIDADDPARPSELLEVALAT